MNYRPDKYQRPLSILGYGCMRFPRKLGIIDMEKTQEQLLAAIARGVNYFDTAYIYPGSEAALGEILERNQLRDKVCITTKLPHYLIRSREGLDKLFNEQLRRLRTERIDYYLMHMLSDVATWEKLKKLGIEEWIAEKKASGQIGQIGFSYHGNSEMFCAIVDAYDWDICMIQYNYMDEHSQAGRRGLRYAHEKGLPVVIMEPLRGGKLVNNLPEEAKAVFAAHPKGYSPAQWAFRWLWNQEEVSCVLSGMNSLAMVEENADTAAQVRVGELSAEEEAMLQRVAAAIQGKMKVPCTGCAYCVPCPKGVDIPGCFAAYNRAHAEGRFWAMMDYIKCTALRSNGTAASNCVGCGKCEQHCPQGIAIRRELKNTEKAMEGPVYGVIRRAIRWLKFF